MMLTTGTPSTVKLFSPAEAPFTWKPPSSSPVFTDGSAVAKLWKLRPFGMTSNCSAGMFRWCVDAPRSMSGVSASDLHRFRQTSDLKAAVDGRRAAEGHGHVRGLLGDESGQFELDRIPSRLERLGQIRTRRRR